MSNEIIPFHKQNQPEVDQEKINQKWYLQEDYLKPPEAISTKIVNKDYGVESNDLYDAAYNGDTLELRNLIARGGCINAPGNFGKTPLHYAVESGQMKTVSFLLRNQANVNAQDGKGETPLHSAARQGHLDIVQLLLHSHAIRDRRNIYDQTPRDLAQNRGNSDCVKELYVVDIDTGEDKTVDHHDPEDPNIALVKVRIRELRLLRMGIFRARTVAKAESMRRQVVESLLKKVRTEFEEFKMGKFEPLKRNYENLEEKHEIAEIKFESRKEQLERIQDQLSKAHAERHEAFLQRDQAINEKQELLRTRADDERGINFTKRRFKDDIKDLEKQKEEFRQKYRSTEEEKEKLEVQVHRLQEKLKNTHDDLEAKRDEISNLKRTIREVEEDANRYRKDKEAAETNASANKLQCKKYENVVIDLKNQQKLLKAELQKAKHEALLSHNPHPQFGTPMLHGGHGHPSQMMGSIHSPQQPQESSSRSSRKKHKHRKHRRR